MIPQGSDQQDLLDFRDMIAEGEGLLEEPITIKRASSSQPTNPGPMQSKPATSWTSIPTTAVIVSMDVAAKLFSAGVLAAGDVVIEIRERLLESLQLAGGTQIADRVVYAGNEYRVEGRPIPQHFGGGQSGDAAFYIVHLRRTNATADTAGG